MSTLSISSVPAPTPVPLPLPAPARPAPPVRTPVAVADRVARSFPPLACVRGYRYFAGRHVELAIRSETEVEAEVKGKRTQSVKLRIDDGRLAAACTCAAKICGPAACRHVWAALLEVDRQGALAGLRSTQRSLALVAFDTTTTPGAKRKRPAPDVAPANVPRKAAGAKKRR